VAPNSPDINPVDYAMLGASQQPVFLGRKFESVDELKRALTLKWGRLLQNIIKQSITEWRQRLQLYRTTELILNICLNNKIVFLTYETLLSSQTQICLL